MLAHSDYFPSLPHFAWLKPFIQPVLRIMAWHQLARFARFGPLVLLGPTSSFRFQRLRIGLAWRRPALPNIDQYSWAHSCRRWAAYISWLGRGHSLFWPAWPICSFISNTFFRSLPPKFGLTRPPFISLLIIIKECRSRNCSLITVSSKV